MKNQKCPGRFLSAYLFLSTLVTFNFLQYFEIMLREFSLSLCRTRSIYFYVTLNKYMSFLSQSIVKIS